ncbi:lytic murein transglycosylase [Patescibacteria group bacterium]|nr:lytic murein transglycosylase [Patescibacteria group bacterium]
MNSATKQLIGILMLAAFLLPSLFVYALTPAQEREQLEAELKALEEEIGAIEGDITKTQQEKKTLQNEISILRNKIRKLDLQIVQSNKIIGDLRGQITDTTFSISRTEEDIEVKRAQLAELLQRLYQEDQRTMVEIVLTGPTLSDFFNNLAALQSLQDRNKELLESTIDLSSYLKGQKGKLETEKSEEENFVKIQILQKQESQYLTGQNQQLLEVTKGKESEYQKLLADRQQQASAIRSRIFELIGVPEAPTFGEAVQIAEAVTQLTKVRAPFLLAVLTQESNIGKNVGQCYLKDTQTGNGETVNGTFVRRVMKPTRDVKPFLEITQELGRDPFNTAVSCPIPSVGGYGGAMGPAQFIPSTWLAYKDEIAQLKGSPADPWNIRDAFLASAVYLADVGATRQTFEYEWCAAVSYFSGNCSSRNQIRYEFYGDNVMAITRRYEQDIAALKGN